MAESHDFDAVDRFTAGTLGEPGARTFLFQAQAGTVHVTVKCEKQQVAALAEYLQGVLADLPAVEGGDDAAVDLALAPPYEPDWVAGTLSVAYDDVADRIVILIEEIGELDDEDEDPLGDDRSSLRVRLTRAQVTALVDHAVELVEGGRPPCPVCGHPMGPDHACPRTNGHGPPR
ncbi:DUF3090 domain-containing protein [Iamia sp. SCSIO 61187]|uniref:DUF3090 family protein n=1 Tax=Iamia sp. SCSIO 61187 TaxID=2722752 RepID=UPI001C630D32|nr:DUF3090 family protein [Iamia sp. SCSIO 61187]QYG91537.1 DUF3090 domain-containing protein [Iamia sp. SCSIO 61187]